MPWIYIEDRDGNHVAKVWSDRTDHDRYVLTDLLRRRFGSVIVGWKNLDVTQRSDWCETWQLPPALRARSQQ